MKKHSFYSMMRRNGKNQAVLHNGYSNSTFYYYKNYYHWEAIHPLCGLSVTSGQTLKEAAKNANAPGMMEKINEAMSRNGKQLTAAFEKAISELKGGAA